MNKIQKTNQSGSIIFMIIGIILTVSLIITVIILRQHSQQARKDQAIAANDRQKSDNSKKSEEAASKVSAIENDNQLQSVNNSQDLPVTGPSMSFGKLVGLYLLTMFFVGYIMSRRNIIRSL